MLSGLGYPLWFVVPPLVLWSAKRQEPYLHFHCLQAVAFGLVASLASLILGFVVWGFYRLSAPPLPSAGTPVGPSAWSGLLGVGVFVAAWLALLFLFSLFVFLGWRASTGEMFRLPLLGAWAEAATRRALDLEEGEEVPILGRSGAESEVPELSPLRGGRGAPVLSRPPRPEGSSGSAWAPEEELPSPRPVIKPWRPAREESPRRTPGVP